MFGYDSTPRLRIASTPPREIRMAITQANTGRSMKKFGIVGAPLPAGRRGVRRLGGGRRTSRRVVPGAGLGRFTFLGPRVLPLGPRPLVEPDPTRSCQALRPNTLPHKLDVPSIRRVYPETT